MRGFRDFCIGLAALAAFFLLNNLNVLTLKIIPLVDLAALAKAFQ